MEDAAHAHGASFKNIHAGNIADISAFSFYATKIVTTAEGGMISTNNKKLNDKCLKLRNHGRSLKNNLFDPDINSPPSDWMYKLQARINYYYCNDACNSEKK